MERDKRWATEKVVKLLRLAKDNSNENEAKVAEGRAQEVARKYGVTRQDVVAFVQAEQGRQRPVQRPTPGPARVVVVHVTGGSWASTASTTGTSGTAYSWVWGGW